MRFKKYIESTVPVENPIQFCASESNLMKLLKRIYEGHCFKGAMVVEILEIAERGQCMIESVGSRKGFVDVRFLALVEVVCRWDILTGVEIQNNTQMVVGVRDRDGSNVVVSLSGPTASVPAQGQIVPVRVVQAIHPPMAKVITAAGVLLTCEKQAPVFRLAGSLESSEAASLGDLVNQIEKELKLRKTLVEARQTDVWFFELLLLTHASTAASTEVRRVEAWPSGPVWEGPVSPKKDDEPSSLISILDIVRRAKDEAVPVDGLWTRPLTVCRSSPLASRTAGENAAAIVGKPVTVFGDFLSSMLNFLAAVREMTGIYNTRELIDSHANVWRAMRAEQQI